MKYTPFSLMLIPFCLATPAMAQTGTVQPPIPNDPVVIQALAQKLLAAGGSGHRSITPHEKANQDAEQKRFSQLDVLGSNALHAADFVSAEQYFREAITISDVLWLHYELAQSLIGQGRVADAIQVYRSVIYQRSQNEEAQFTVPVSLNPAEMQSGMYLRECGTWEESEDWMRYALLLSQTGQQKEAVTIYLKALPLTPLLDEQVKSILSDTDSLSLTAFQAATHIAIGLCVSQTTGDDVAMREFVKAQQLQPNSPVTNYYYGFGWQKLSPSDRAKFGSPEKARAALELAARLGKGQVKVAAQKALQVASVSK